jgi:hypothetical protein
MYCIANQRAMDSLLRALIEHRREAREVKQVWR